MLNFNSAPYFDDFDPTKSFHRILFRGGLPVQTRELTQLQTILQNQITSFANVQFRNGQCIVPGSQTYVQDCWIAVVEMNLDAASFDDIKDYTETPVRFRGLDSNVIMELCYYNKLSNTEVELFLTPYKAELDPNLDTNESGDNALTINVITDEETNTVSYSSDASLVSEPTATLFKGGEDIVLWYGETSEETEVTLTDNNDEYNPEFYDTEYDTYTESWGYINYQNFAPATLAKVTGGIYYVNGYFVQNLPQTIVVSRVTQKPTATVGFYVKEEVITPYDDNTLFDNSVGYEAENSSGAHRYKIDLTLAVKDAENELDNLYDFITLTKIKNGQIIQDNSVIQEEDRTWLFDILARRTYEESGNYTVKDYNFDVKKYIYEDDDGDTQELPDFLTFRAYRGESYVGGYQLDNTTTPATVGFSRARQVVSVNNAIFDVDYGNYILVTDCVGLPDVNDLIMFRSNGKVVASSTNANGFASGVDEMSNVIGYASVYNVELEWDGTIVKENNDRVSVHKPVWRIYIYDVQLNDGLDLSSARFVTNFRAGGNADINFKGLVTFVENFSNIDGVFSVDEFETGVYIKNNRTTNTNAPINRVIGPKYSGLQDIVDEYGNTTPFYVIPFGTKLANNTCPSQDLIKTKTQVKFIFNNTSVNTTAVISSIETVQEGQKSSYLIPMTTGVVKDTTDYSYFVRQCKQMAFPGTAKTQSYTNTDTSVLISDPIAIASDGEVLKVEAKDGRNISISRTGTSGNTTFKLWFTEYHSLGSIEPKNITITNDNDPLVYKSSVFDSEHSSLSFDDYKEISAIGILSVDKVVQFTSNEFNVNESYDDITDHFYLVNQDDTTVRKNCYLKSQSGKIAPDASIGVFYTYCAPPSYDAPFAISTVNSYAWKNRTDLDYMEKIPSLKNNGNEYNLYNCIDHRPKYKQGVGYIYGSKISDYKANSNETYTRIQIQPQYPASLVGVNTKVMICGTKYDVKTVDVDTNTITLETNLDYTFTDVPIIFSKAIIQENGEPNTPDIGVSLIDPNCRPLANKKYVQMDYQYWQPRRDIVYLQSNGELRIDEGVPADNPRLAEPIDNEYQMPIASLYVPAYTFRPNDVSITPYVNKRYTMKDIGKLENRIESLENAMTLSLLENNVNNMTIVDSNTGLDRYKTGWVVDGFNTMNLVDYTSDTIGQVDVATKCFKPLAENFSIDTVLVQKQYNQTGYQQPLSDNYTITDGILSIDYEEEVMIEQDAASEFHNVNPYTVYNWGGYVELSPSIDTWQDTAEVVNYTYNFSLSRGRETNGGWNKNPDEYYNNLISYLKEKEILKSNLYYEGL